MRNALLAAVAVEVAAGVALLAAPSPGLRLLVGVPVEGPAAAFLARLLGAAVLALALACLPAIRNPAGPGARTMVATMLLYNLAALAVLVHASLVTGLSGDLLWPSVGLHAVLSGWLLRGLGR